MTCQWTEDGEPYLELKDGYRLTPMREEDLEAWLRLRNDPERIKWNFPPAGPIDLEEAKRQLRDRIDSAVEPLEALRKGEKSHYTPFIAIRTPDGELIGSCALTKPFVPGKDVPEEYRRWFAYPNIGWCVSMAHTGRGLATTAAKALVDYCRVHNNAEYIVGGGDAANDRSMAIFKSAGFEMVYVHTHPPGMGIHPEGKALWWVLKLPQVD